LVLDIVRAGNQKDTFVLFVTFFLTIIFDMVVGVASGLALSYVLKIYKR
jgi:MFS superfamily sulfate permease-like transporter